MFRSKETKSILVIGSTGRVGTEVCKALKVANDFSVFGATRTVPNKKLEDMGVKAIKFEFGSMESMISALKESNATMVFMVTDFWVAANQKFDVEVSHGMMMIQAMKEIGTIEHVVFNSVADAEKTPPEVQHFATKLKLEEELKLSGLSYSVLRPVAFLENLDDPANMNPLTKGTVKCLWDASLTLKMVACADIAKAAVLMFKDPKKFQGQIIDCVGCQVNGDEIAQALSKASGVRCVWQISLPRPLQYLIIPDVYYMVSWFYEVGYSSSIEEFKKIVPDAMGPFEWFQAKGQWNNGDKFSPKPDGEPLDDPAADTCSIQ
mmetsp:Transcript_15241/g.20155  ORF Transcript_15241/g.20155 Transcript_15241/m.20155 type:complete len:320 (+) Transcript_15241:103-1062(+)